MGVELELEGFGSRAITAARDALHPLWLATSDGSLRNGGVEFVTNGGLGGTRLHDAFVSMDALLSRQNYDASFRCSTHMHINMLDFTFNQVARFLLTYAACEPVLFTFCGAHRRSSNFCVPVAESLPFHKKLISRLYDDAISSGRSGSAQVCNKYTAMNFLPLFDGGRDRAALGTVEFRGGRPLTTLAEFITQANLLLSIKAYVRAHSEGTDDEFLTELSSHGAVASVYSNGANAGLDTPQGELDDALVTAWCLLKSYQNGKTQWAERATRRADDEEAARLQPPVRSNNTFGNWNPSVFQVQAEGVELTSRFPERPFLGGEPPRINQMLYGALFILGLATVGPHEPYTSATLPWTNQQWPKLHMYLAHAQDRTISMGSVKAVILEVLKDQNSVVKHTPSEAHKALMGFMMTKGFERTTNQVVDFLLACGLAKAQGFNVALTRNGNPVLMGACETIEYETHLSQSNWSDLRVHLGYMPTAVGARAVSLWDRLLRMSVRVKNKVVLREAIEGRTGRNAPIGVEIPAVTLMVLLNTAGRSSESHVHRDDLAVYDQVVAVCRIICDRALKVPHHYGDQLRTINPFTYSLDGRIVENRIPRVSRTTGQEVY